MAPRFLSKNDEDDKGNRLSDLPDAVIHHIFSLLEMNDFLHVGLLSKRLRHVFLSSPYIYLASNPEKSNYGKKIHTLRKLVDRYFHESDDEKEIYISREHYNCGLFCNEFINFVNNYMSARGDSVIQSFHLDLTKAGRQWSCYHDEWRFLDKWLHQAATCKVQELYLNVHFNSAGPADSERKLFSLPHGLLSSNCLRVLELDLHENSFQLPSYVLGSLESLSLNCSSLSGELTVEDWISTHCPSLNSLSLLSIEALNLHSDIIKDLTLILTKKFSRVVVSCDNLLTLSLHLRKQKNETGYLKVSAPKLQVLKWVGNPETELDFGGFPCLTDATFYKCPFEDGTMSCLDCLLKIIKSSSSVKVLRIPLSVTEALFMKDVDPLMFDNLRHLVISYHPKALEDYHTAVISDFIGRSPNLTSLIIDHKKITNDRYYRGSWSYKVAAMIGDKAEDFKQKNRTLGSRMLSDVKIQLAVDGDSKIPSLALLKYLVRNTDGLKKMTILYPASCFHKLCTLFKEEEIRAFGRAEISSAVKELENEEDRFS